MAVVGSGVGEPIQANALGVAGCADPQFLTLPRAAPAHAGVLRHRIASESGMRNELTEEA